MKERSLFHIAGVLKSSELRTLSDGVRNGRTYRERERGREFYDVKTMGTRFSINLKVSVRKSVSDILHSICKSTLFARHIARTPESLSSVQKTHDYIVRYGVNVT